jgi:hypothetical protein
MLIYVRQTVFRSATNIYWAEMTQLRRFG